MSAKGRKVAESGQLSIPVEMLRAIGIEHGGDVVVELIGNEIRIRTVAEAIARAQELTRRVLEGVPDSSVDDFIAWRRAETERD